MQVILHVGVHCTDEDRILKCLLRNADTWRHEGVAIPGPSKYRRLLGDAITKLKGTTPGEDVREVLLDAILTEDPHQIDRLVLSNDNFFSVPKLALDERRLYLKAESRLQTFADIFAGDDVEIFMGLRNPATFLPATFGATPHEEFGSFLNGMDPMHLRWSDLIRRIREAVPQVPVTVWCNEDTPIIWGEVIRGMAGIEMTRKITGAFDLFSRIIDREGMKRFRAFLAENPHINEMQKRRVMAAFLDKYAMDEEIEEDVDLPGWDAAYIDRLTERYEADLGTIAEMHGVSLITP
ncbi:hypothetical protein [Sagittula salina]|uniref:Uncharacterized protein n=1 Tax=Sagittula salina TaxID=2820268 RepID=A0A940S312_9RHOB|nr:hypothetical protein [Sagittula salina]MBP0484637.1 hypothetical protein [Sagittula salina]